MRPSNDVRWNDRDQWPSDHWSEMRDRSPDAEAQRGSRPQTSTPSSSSAASHNITGEVQASWPTWLARNVPHVCDGALGTTARYRDTVRSETATPSFSSSPWI